MITQTQLASFLCGNMSKGAVEVETVEGQGLVRYLLSEVPKIEVRETVEKTGAKKVETVVVLHVVGVMRSRDGDNWEGEKYEERSLVLSSEEYELSAPNGKSYLTWRHKDGDCLYLCPKGHSSNRFKA